MSLAESIPLATCLVVLAVLSAYGVHRYLMIWRWMHRRRTRVPPPPDTPRLPVVTVQLPVFNERYVVVRLLRAIAAMDYPRDRLEVQVLDDSTDDTTSLAAAEIAALVRSGLDVVMIHREVRTGFKAGALAAGLERARGEFIAVFDADFLPPPDFLRRTLRHFAPGIGMVQARWGHLNDADRPLTRVQAMLLDGHFVIEHAAREAAGCWFNFNGTAGIWRRRCIQEAGGWHFDTLTEDLDLSYRAQAAGWRFVYLPELVVPAELPATMRAFKCQQHRWAKGSIQTARKLLPGLLRSNQPLRIKVEASMHLAANLAYPLMLLLSALLPLTVQARRGVPAGWLDVVVLVLATFSVGLFYGVSQWAVQPDWARRCLGIPLAMALGIGLSVNQSRAVFQALRGQESPFVRTPKLGGRAARGHAYEVGRDWTPLAELAMAAWYAVATAAALWQGAFSAVPLFVLFGGGFAWVGWRSLRPARLPPAKRLAHGAVAA